MPCCALKVGAQNILKQSRFLHSSAETLQEGSQPTSARPGCVLSADNGGRSAAEAGAGRWPRSIANKSFPVLSVITVLWPDLRLPRLAPKNTCAVSSLQNELEADGVTTS